MKKTGTIKGVVEDRKHQPQVGAEITVAESNLIAVTDLKGEYVLEDVAEGRHDVTVTMVLAKKTKQVAVPADGTVTLDFTIDPLRP